jgi:hypothetical protein
LGGLARSKATSNVESELEACVEGDDEVLLGNGFVPAMIALEEAGELEYRADRAGHGGDRWYPRLDAYPAEKVPLRALAENNIFHDTLTDHNRQGGLIRYLAFPEGSRTPRCFHCHVDAKPPDCASDRYGTPDYCRLLDTAGNAALPYPILTGAEYGDEMGVYYRLFDPLRLNILERRLKEYLPLGVTARVFFVT